jgi:conjugal transfer pilus assembly protein TraV
MRHTAHSLAPLLVLGATLAGCASGLSGIGGTDGYACKAPAGAQCTSVSGVYANTAQGMPMPAKAPENKLPSLTPALYGAASIAPAAPATSPRTSMRSSPRVLRLWVAPWEDADGDLHEESLVHVLVDTGRWLIETARPAPRNVIDGVAPPLPSAQDAAPSRLSTDAPQPPTRFPLPPTGEPAGADAASMER